VYHNSSSSGGGHTGFSVKMTMRMLSLTSIALFLILNIDAVSASDGVQPLGGKDYENNNDRRLNVVRFPSKSKKRAKRAYAEDSKERGERLVKYNYYDGGKGNGKGGKKGGKGKGKGNQTYPPHPESYVPTSYSPPVSSPTPPPTISSTCSSPVADAIRAGVPEVITKNPYRCCNFDGPTAVFVTHAEADSSTPSGFEVYWNSVYDAILQTSKPAGVCFVMTGIDSSVTTAKTVSEVLIATNALVSQLSSVPAMMATDPTDSVPLMNQLRSISDSPDSPSIGVFNAGYNNIIIESLVTGNSRLPYVGLLDDANYGHTAAKATLELLDGVPARPLCFNGRIGMIALVGERCQAYYEAVTDTAIEPATGVGCSSSSSASDILNAITENNANAVWTHVDCCSAVAEAVAQARANGMTIIGGCQDKDTSGGLIDFVTAQPIELQGYQASSWVNLPVVQSENGGDGRGGQYFPGLQSFINTEIYNIILV